MTLTCALASSRAAERVTKLLDNLDELSRRIALSILVASLLAAENLFRQDVEDGTMEQIIRALVPRAFVTAISPFHWAREYYLVSLAGARLNVVGELPDQEAIPAAAFKSVIGGDLQTIPGGKGANQAVAAAQAGQPLVQALIDATPAWLLTDPATRSNFDEHLYI